MVETTWYYARGGERVGPLTAEQMRALAADGQLRRDDSVWADGMSHWAPAGGQPELFDVMPPSAVIAVAGATDGTAAGGAPARPGTVGYYVSTSGMPGRAAEHLRGHATPAGDTGDWPLDDPRVAVFRETMKLRKKVVAAAQLYKALFALAIIAGVILLLVTLGLGAGGRRGGGGPALGFALAIPLGVLLVVTLLYFFAWRATTRSQRWAPLTMLVLFLIAVALNVLGMALVLMGRGEPSALVTGVIGMVFPLLFAVVSWNAFAAIPKYLAQPAWCQEIIAASDL